MLVAVLCLIRNSHHFLFGLKLFKSGKDPEPHSQAIFEAAFMASRGAKSACGQDNHPPNHPPNRPNHPTTQPPITPSVARVLLPLAIKRAPQMNFTQLDLAVMEKGITDCCTLEIET